MADSLLPNQRLMSASEDLMGFNMSPKGSEQNVAGISCNSSHRIGAVDLVFVVVRVALLRQVWHTYFVLELSCQIPFLLFFDGLEFDSVFSLAQCSGECGPLGLGPYCYSKSSPAHAGNCNSCRNG